MTRFATSASALALCCSAMPVLAELSPEQVWNEIQGLYEGTYSEVSFDDPTQDGDTLVVENLTLRLGDDNEALSVVVPEMRLRAAESDSVEITTSEIYDVTVISDAPDTPDEFSIELSQSGLLITATGAPMDIDWAYAVDSMTMGMRALDDAEGFEIDATAIINDLTGDISSNQEDGLYSFAGRFNAARGLVEAAAQSPDGPFDATMAFNELAYDVDGALPLGLFSEGAVPSLPEMIEAGFRFDITSQSGGADIGVKGTDDEGAAFDATVTMQPSEAVSKFGPDGLVLSSNSQGFDLRVQGDALPDVIEASLERLALNYTFPVSEGDQPQAFGIGWSLIDLTLAESVWALFDPEGNFDRAPLSLDFAINGMARLGKGFWDNEEPDFEQAELQELNLERFLISAIGAELSGAGAFEMQGEPNIAFGGLPTPVGKANFSLTGLNAALDGLVAAELVPAEQLLGIRMGLGMVAVQNGDDSYASEIEVTEDGAVMVNGNRMR